ncbi:hypothetical protein N2152v2_002513 [Parachlorella kessleri]
MFRKAVLLCAFAVLLPLKVLADQSVTQNFCTWNYMDIYTLPLGVVGGGQTIGENVGYPTCMASDWLNYDAVGGFAGILFTYSDGSTWSVGDVTGNGGMAQSPQALNMTNQLVTGATVYYCTLAWGGTTPCGIQLQLVDNTGATSTAQLGKDSSQAVGTAATASMPNGAILAGAVGSWWNPMATIVDTLGLMFFTDISSVTANVVAWPELANQKPGNPTAWSLLSLDGCSSANGSAPSESATFTWTSTKSLQFTASISIGMSEKTAVKFQAGIPDIEEEDVTEELSFSMSDTFTTSTTLTETVTQTVTVTVPGVAGYQRLAQFVSFEGTLNTPVNVNYTIYFQNGITYSWMKQESFSGVIGYQLFTTWQDTPCQPGNPDTPVRTGMREVPKNRPRVVLAI